MNRLLDGDVVAKKYKILNHIGSGGFSDVYKAIDLKINRVVAIKEYHDKNNSVFHELEILKELRHRYLPQVYDVIKYKQSDLLVMEFVDGQDLLSVVQGHGAFLPEIAINYALQLCEVAGYLHSHNPQIIHGDIKPNNIILRSTGEICLIDYNLSQAFNDFMRPIGRTNGYSPPEFFTPWDWRDAQRDFSAISTAAPISSTTFTDDTLLLLRNFNEYKQIKLFSSTEKQTKQENPIEGNAAVPSFSNAVNPVSIKSTHDTKEGTHTLTIKSDIYSIGATLYYCLTAQHPWPYDRVKTSLLESQDDSLISRRSAHQLLEPYIGNIILRCLAFEPSDRFVSVDHLKIELCNHKTYDYDVALSFAGENREYVRRVAQILSSRGVKVFYDENEQESLWGKDLFQYLDVIYQKRAKYCMVFISEHYKRKLWTKHEIKSVFARVFIEENDYFLPVVFDDTQLPGLRVTTGYLDARLLSPEEVSSLFIRKLTNVEVLVE